MLVVLLVVVRPCSAQSGGHSTPSDKNCVLSKPEIEIYRSQLADESLEKSLMVIAASTEGWIEDIDSFNLSLATQGRGISPEVRTDFTAKNRVSCVIQPFAAVSNLRFISKNDQKRLASDDWNTFQRKYGRNAEYVVLSRVGFNADKTLALIHVLYSGFGRLYLYELTEGKWRIKYSVPTRTS